MATLAAGNHTEVYAPLEYSITITPGSGGHVEFGCSSPSATPPAPRRIHAAESITIPPGSTIFMRAEGADATYLEPSSGSSTVITSYTAAELAAMALAGTLTPNASYRASDTGARYFAPDAYTLELDEPVLGLVDVDFHVGGDNATRQFTITLGDWRKITVKRAISPGGQGGSGGPDTGDQGGGAGGSAGCVLEDYDLDVFPFETLYITIGAAYNTVIAAGSTENGHDGTAITAIRRTSHSGTNLLLHPTLWPTGLLAGLGGAYGSSTTSGVGAAAPAATFNGKTAPAGGVARTTQNNGASGAVQTFPTRIVPPTQARMLCSDSTGSGGFATTASGTGATGGAAAPQGYDFITSQRSGGAGNVSPLVAGGSVGAATPCSNLRNNFGAPGGFGSSASAQNTGRTHGNINSMPGGGGGGGASGRSGGFGGHGMLTLTVPNDPSVLDTWPGSLVYNPAGTVVVNDHFFGMHMPAWPYGGSGSVTVDVGNNRITVSGTTVYANSGNAFNIILTSGTPPGGMTNGVRYYLKPTGTNNVVEVYTDTDRANRVTLSAGASSPYGTIYTDPPDAGLAFGSHRAFCGSGGIGSVGWADLQPGNNGAYTPGTGASVPINTAARDRLDDLVEYLVNNGRVLNWNVKSAPGWSTTGTAADAWSVPGGAGKPNETDLTYIIQYVISRYNSTLYPTEKPIRFIEVYNEPIWGSLPDTMMPVDCVDIHKWAKAAIAGSADTTVKVVSCAMGSGSSLPGLFSQEVGSSAGDRRYLQFLLATATTGGQKGWEVVDVLAFHPYDAFTEDSRIFSTNTGGAGIGGAYEFTVQSLIRQIRYALSAAGITGASTFPIRFTEWGNADRSRLFPHVPQSAAISRMMAAGLGLGMHGIDYFGYTWSDDIASTYDSGDAGYPQQLARNPIAQQALGALFNACTGKTIAAGGAIQRWDGKIKLTFSDASTFTTP